jgi:phosphatidylserine decarboxylase
MNDLLKTIYQFIHDIRLHPAGYIYIILFAVGSILLALLSDTLGLIGLVLTLWCIYFFRDPERVTPTREGLIVSPADGVIQKIEKVTPPSEMELGEEERFRISIFLNVFDVHVNRIPYSGVIKKLEYREGLFLNAALDKASEDNERQLVVIESEDKTTFGVVQIAGLVARRIICDLAEKQPVESGERFGIIRFGSRVDLYLPPKVNPLCIVGQQAVGGETVLADKKGRQEAQREGITR